MERKEKIEKKVEEKKREEKRRKKIEGRKTVKIKEE